MSIQINFLGGGISLKKITMLALALLLTLSPVSPALAETVSDDANEQASDVDLDEQSDSESSTEVTEADSENATTEDEDIEEADANEDGEDPVDENVANEEDEVSEDETSENETTDSTEGTEEETDELDDGEENEEIDEEEEELNLTDVFGRASGEVTYDFNRGYYVLDLRAGITNFHTQQKIKNKWVAFTLPNGVQIADELPSGVVPIGIAGKSGLAVKIPDVNSSSSEHVDKEIALLGVEDDNDPHLNMYLLDVDVNSNSYEEIGQLRGQREIDFTVMEENPTIDLHGSITGNTTYDEEEKYHFLDVSVQALNQTNDSVNDLYVAFELPEGVEVVQDENTPANMEILNLDGARAVALKLPNLDQGKEGELTYQIPVVGVSDAIVTSETISVFKILDAGYNQVGEFDGHINVDFSDMDIAWHFDAIAQIIPDYPGIEDNQFGFNFAYEVKNIDVADVEKVKIDFNVPSAITIEKPEYTGGSSVEIDWDGNDATVTIGDLDGASGYEGYFTAVGSTNRSLDQLTGMEVTVTLYRDGDTVVETLTVPFEVGSYDNIGLPSPEPTPGDPEDPEEPTPQEPGDDDQGTGGDDNNTKDPGTNNGDSQSDGTTDEDDDDTTVTIEDGDDSVTGSGDENDESGLTLPSTATNMYSYLLIGAIILIAGASMIIFRKKSILHK